MASVLHGSARNTPRILARAHSSESAGPSPRQSIRPQRQNRPEMAQSDRDIRCANGAQKAKKHCPDVGRRGHHCGISTQNAPATRRCAGGSEEQRPKPQPKCLTSLPPAARDLPVAGGRDHRKAQMVQDLGNWLRQPRVRQIDDHAKSVQLPIAHLNHRHRTSPQTCRRQIAPVTFLSGRG